MAFDYMIKESCVANPGKHIVMILNLCFRLNPIDYSGTSHVLKLQLRLKFPYWIKSYFHTITIKLKLTTSLDVCTVSHSVLCFTNLVFINALLYHYCWIIYHLKRLSI